MPLTPDDQQAIVGLHNKYRSDPAINTPNLQWDDTLVAGAQDWANKLAQGQPWGHSPDAMAGTIGENIAQSTKGNRTPAQMADMWKTDEQPNFKPGIFPDVKKDSTKEVGHYTQLIWGTNAKVGCALASSGTLDYLVCRYSPGGNKNGVGVPSPQPVTLAQVSVASATLAFGVDAANNVYYYMSTDGTTWTPQYSMSDSRQMKQVSVASDYTVCGLDPNGAIWQGSFASSPFTWTQMAAGPVAFRYVSCGSASNMWAIGTDSQYYQYAGSSWTKIPSGGGQQVNLGDDGTIWGLATNGGVWQYIPSNKNFTRVGAGAYAQISYGSATNLWATGVDNKFYLYNGTSWVQTTSGTGKQVSVASDGTVWAIGTDNKVSRLVNNAWTQLLV